MEHLNSILTKFNLTQVNDNPKNNSEVIVINNNKLNYDKTDYDIINKNHPIILILPKKFDFNDLIKNIKAKQFNTYNSNKSTHYLMFIY